MHSSNNPMMKWCKAMVGLPLSSFPGDPCSAKTNIKLICILQKPRKIK